MKTDDLERIKKVLPSYESLPDLLDTAAVSRLIGLHKNYLPQDRCGARKVNMGFVKIGRHIRYPKTEVVKYLLQNAKGGDLAHA